MHTGFNHIEKAVRLLFVLTAALMALSIGGCGPSEKQLKEDAERQAEEAERQAKEAEGAKIEKLQSIVRDSLRDPASAQFRRTKLLYGEDVLCGEVNSKNEYGGFEGFERFAVNSAGRIVILDAIPAAEVTALSKKTKKEREEYVEKWSVEFAKMGLLGLGVRIALQLDQMEQFDMDDFSLWVDCLAEK